MRNSFSAARDGGVALIFALTLPAMMLGVSLATDMVHVSSVRSQLGNAADNAVLAALSNRATDPRAFAEAQFRANIASAMPDLDLQQVTVTIDSSNPNAWAARIDYEARVELFWRNLLPVDFLTVSGTRAATSGGDPAHLDITFLLDYSATMDLPEDPNGPPVIFESGCYFACHGLETTRLPGFEHVRTRLDVAKDAIRDMTREVAESPEGANTAFSLLAFDRYTTTYVDHVTDPLQVEAALDDIVPHNNTDIVAALNAANAFIGPVGDGSGPGSRRQAVILISDGDHRRALNPWSFAACDALKARGVDLYTLYLPVRIHWLYQRREHEAWFRQLLEEGGFLDGYWAPVVTAQQRMRDCASGSSFAFLANGTGDIDAAVQGILQSVVNGAVRLNQ